MWVSCTKGDNLWSGILSARRCDMPGLAHFLEHMLFTGTEKYPSEGEYAEFVAQNGGSRNANTTCNFTNYFLSIKPDKFEEALDRFSQFFTAPLLTKDCINREINAVDSEFQMGFTSDWWRAVGLHHHLSNPEHPWHVACGNNKMLKDDPLALGVDLYAETVALYEATYGAQGLTVCVIAQEPLDQLETMVREKFGAVATREVPLEIAPSVSVPVWTNEVWNTTWLRVPSADSKSVSFSWVLDWQGPLWKDKPMSYLNYLMGDEGPGSLIALLKRAGWISSGWPFTGAWMQGCFSFFSATFELTDVGLKHVREIGEYFFIWLAMVTQQPVSRRVWEETKKIKDIKFMFQDDRDPISLTTTIAKNMQVVEDPTEVIAGPNLFYEFNPEAIDALHKQITLDAMRVELVSKTLIDRCDAVEPQYGTPYRVEAIQPDWMETWTSAFSACSVDEAVAKAKGLDMFLPPANPFIPDDLSVQPATSGTPKLPERVESHNAVIYHKLDDQFEQPKATVEMQLQCPYLCQEGSVGAERLVKASIWCDVVEEAMNEFAYPAQAAGLSYALFRSDCGLKIQASGFNDKLPVLIETIGKQMRSMAEVPRELYEMVMDKKRDSFKNDATKKQPRQQAANHHSELLSRPAVTRQQRHEAMGSVTVEDIINFGDLLLEGTHVEVLAIGNLDATAAEALTDMLVSSAQLEPVPDACGVQHAALLEGRTLWKIDSCDQEDPNHCVCMWAQFEYTLEEHCLLLLLKSILGQKFFDVLRTQQQLGYVVGMGASRNKHFLSLQCLVQSEYAPSHIQGSIDAFLEEHFAWVQDGLLDAELQQCLAGLISQLETRPKSLREEFNQYQTAFERQTYDFAVRDAMIRFLKQGVEMDVIRQFSANVVATAPRIYIQVHKVMDKEDKTLESTAARSPNPVDREWSGELNDVLQTFKDSASWQK
eukprot:TRINITY_DN8994_c0_g1_i1.p1 TRINITY_DN8994_c0_g1~~TRINITY_DN8994_c0_g1_i1.p1  ORF type:complete len:937 (+),score=241.05 TRINITY_DN8994_c0_g1_i1:184-2994(+)